MWYVNFLKICSCNNFAPTPRHDVTKKRDVSTKWRKKNLNPNLFTLCVPDHKSTQLTWPKNKTIQGAEVFVNRTIHSCKWGYPDKIQLISIKYCDCTPQAVHTLNWKVDIARHTNYWPAINSFDRRQRLEQPRYAPTKACTMGGGNNSKEAFLFQVPLKIPKKLLCCNQMV